MATLQVTASHDYRADTLANIAQVDFDGPFTVIFDQSQFGGTGISNSLYVTGGVLSEPSPLIEVHLSAGGTGFSAAGWSVGADGLVVVRMIGTALDDVITGTKGGWARNEFRGGAGADTLVGGSGDDLFIYSATGDVESGEKIDGGGYDPSSGDTISVRASNDFRLAQVTGIARVEILGDGTVATFSADQLRVPGDDFVEKRGMFVRGDENSSTVQTLVVHADVLAATDFGYANIEYFYFWKWGKEDRVYLNGTNHDDYLTGSDVADIVDAGVGKDELFGRHGKDTLDGGAGRDFLDGGAEKDILTGGTDRDAFVFAAPLKGGKNLDRITDFEEGTDIIRLEREEFLGLKKGKLAKDAFVSGDDVSKAKDGQDRIAYNETTGDLYFDKDGKGGVKAVKFAVLDGAPHLESGDIIVFA